MSGWVSSTKVSRVHLRKEKARKWVCSVGVFVSGQIEK